MNCEKIFSMIYIYWCDGKLKLWTFIFHPQDILKSSEIKIILIMLLGLDNYLILRTDKPPEEIGLEGNLLVDRLVHSNIRLVTKDEYSKYGQYSLLDMMEKELVKQGRKPYIIPVEHWEDGDI